MELIKGCIAYISITSAPRHIHGTYEPAQGAKDSRNPIINKNFVDSGFEAYLYQNLQI